MKSALLVRILLLCLATAPANGAEALLQQLRAELKAEARAAQENGGVWDREQFYRFEELLIRLQHPPTIDDYDNRFEQDLAALSQCTLSKKIGEMGSALAAEIKDNREKSKREDQEQAEKIYADALRAALDAKTAKEIDEPLASVTELNGEITTPNPELPRLVEEGRDLREFLMKWQDCLAAIESGDASEIKRNLSRLPITESNLSRLMPNAKMLDRTNDLRRLGGQPLQAKPGVARENPVMAAREIIVGVKTFDDLAGAAARLEAMPPELTGHSSEFGSIERRLRSLSDIYDDLHSGLANDDFLDRLMMRAGVDDTDVLAPLGIRMLLYALPRVLGLPEDETARPDETVATFLQRCLAEAKARKDWAAVQRIADVATFTLNLPAVAGGNDVLALHFFLGGLNQERARQFSLAVASYHAALKRGSPIGLAEMIGARLAAIKEANPEEFEKGMQITRDNPPRYP